MNNQSSKNPKHLGSFWPIFIVVIVSMIAGGIVYSFASTNNLQSELESISFPSHFSAQKSVKKIPAKPAVKAAVIKK